MSRTTHLVILRHVKRSNPRTHSKEGAEINTKGIKKLFNEIIAKKFLNTEKEIDIKIKDI